jgi:hypothetical protein
MDNIRQGNNSSTSSTNVPSSGNANVSARSFNSYNNQNRNNNGKYYNNNNNRNAGGNSNRNNRHNNNSVNNSNGASGINNNLNLAGLLPNQQSHSFQPLLPLSNNNLNQFVSNQGMI